MASKIDVINLALRRLGEQPIGAIDEGSEPANIVSDIYDILLENELRCYPYRWATTTAELALISAEEPTDFEYVFQLPADYLQILRIISPESGKSLTSTEWEVRESKLYLDYDEVEIKYIFLETDVSKWDANFQNAFAFKLAEEASLALTGMDNLTDMMMQKYLRHINKARHSNGKETRRSHPWGNTYVDARKSTSIYSSTTTDETSIT